MSSLGEGAETCTRGSALPDVAWSTLHAFRSNWRADFVLDNPWTLLQNFTHMKTRIQSIFIVITVLFLGLLLQVQAVSPAPDGCYPAFTTAEGCNALALLGAGVGNTGVGWYSLFLVGDASFNTGVGAGALALNTTGADSNTAVGAAAMLLNTTGILNTAVGTDALLYNDSGSFNNAVGVFALFNNIDGFDNNAFGESALGENIHAGSNTAIGDLALSHNDNTGNGFASFNTAVGASALQNNTDGGSNTAVGAGALSSNDTGNSNTAVGVGALPDNISGIENTAVGSAALFTNIDGSHNIAVGQAALSNNTSGSNNIAVGEFAGLAVTTSNNVISIGVQGQDISDSCFIGNIFNAMAPSGSAVFIDANNRLGTITSSKRFKEDIKPIGKSSEALLELKPVTFRYKKEIDPAARSQFGLVAEEVEKVNPDLVVRDKEGKPYSVRYEQVNAMLLNEFLKEHNAFVEEQQKVAQQQEEIDLLKAELKEQRSLIQKVSDKVELKRSTPQVVVNNQ